MTDQKDYIINLYKQMPTIENRNRTIAEAVNKKFKTDFWDCERVRDVIRKHKKREMRNLTEKIDLPQHEEPQKFSIEKKKIMVTGDWHFPYHREDLIDIIQKHKGEIDAFIVGGDAINNDSLSRFLGIGKKPFEEELIEFYIFVKSIREILPLDVPMIFIRGNHSARLYKAIAAMQEKGLQKFINPDVLAMLEDGFTIYENGKKNYYPPIENLKYIPHWFCNINQELIVCHPEENSKVNVKTAVEAVKYFLKREESFSTCIVFHTHKYGDTIENNKWAIQSGCMCRPQKYSDCGKFAYSPQDYTYTIFEFDENGCIDKNASKIYILDEIYPISDNIRYNLYL